MNSFGREDQEDFQVLGKLLDYCDSLCYDKWKIPLGIHSEEAANLMVDARRLIENTEHKIAELDDTPVGLRIWKDVDYEIGMAYRNGINLALNLLVQLESFVFNYKPVKVLI